METQIILLVSRDFLLTKLLQRIDELGADKLLVVVDGEGKLFVKVRNMLNKMNIDTLCVHGFNTQVPKSQVQRRSRIAALHNIARTHVEASNVLLLEDDGIPPKNTLKRLQSLYKDDMGFVSGLEVGRWMSPYIGGWRFDNVDDPQELASVSPDETGVIEVHSAGFYAMYLSADIYKNHEFKTNPNWGPDIQFGLEISKHFKNYMDTGLVIEHYNGDTKITPSTRAPKQVRLTRRKNSWNLTHRVHKQYD